MKVQKYIYLGFFIFLFKSTALFGHSEKTKWDKKILLKVPNRALEGKYIFTSLSHIEDVGLFSSTLESVKKKFELKNDTPLLNAKYMSDAKHMKNKSLTTSICFKSSDRSDQSIIIFSSFTKHIYSFELYRNGSEYYYFSKCKLGKKEIKNIRLGNDFLSLNTDLEKVRNVFGMGEEDTWSYKNNYNLKTNYKKNYKVKTIKDSLHLFTYYLHIYFDKNKKAKQIFYSRKQAVKQSPSSKGKKQNTHAKP